MKKVLITGMSGLLGGNIAYLLKDKYDIVGVDLLQSNITGAKLYIADILKEGCIEDIILNEKPDIIVHCMAMVNVDACEENEELADKMNAKITGEIVRCANKINSKVIYISTDAVFDGEDEKLYTEEDTPNPVSVYAMTKLNGEKLVLNVERNVVLRTNIYGYNIIDKNSFGEWVLSSLYDDQTLNMFTDVMYSPILVNDLSEIIDKIIEKNVSGLFHACATGAISKYNFGILIKKIFGIELGAIVPCSVNDFNFKAKRTKNMSMDNSTLCNILGISIPNPEQSINKFKKLYDENYNLLLKKLR